jgi:hypothetical protein
MWPTTAEVAEKTGFTQRHIRRLCNGGVLSCVQRGKTWFVDPESLREFEATRGQGRKQSQTVESEA